MGFVASKLTIGPKSVSKIFEAHHGAPAKGGKLASITSQNAISRVMMHGEKWKPADEPGRQRSMPVLGAHRSGPFFFVELEHRLTDSLGQHPSLSCGLTLLFSFLCSSFKGPRGPEKKLKKKKKKNKSLHLKLGLHVDCGCRPALWMEYQLHNVTFRRDCKTVG